jgi:flagella basal body P-ring formation protein FlgA
MKTKFGIGILFISLLLSTGLARGGTIADRITEHIIETFDFNPKTTEIVVRPEIDTIFIPDSVDVIVSCREYPEPSGHFPLKVILQQPNGALRTMSTAVDVLFYRDVLVANRRVKSRQPLSESDFDIERVEINSLVRTPVESYDRIKGMRSSRTISAGRVLTENMLEPEPVVKRGERVRILFKSGTLTVESYGTAKRDAIEGETVEVENNASGKKIYGRAVEGGVVLVEN